MPTAGLFFNDPNTVTTQWQPINGGLYYLDSTTDMYEAAMNLFVRNQFYDPYSDPNSFNLASDLYYLDVMSNAYEHISEFTY